MGACNSYFDTYFEDKCMDVVSQAFSDLRLSTKIVEPEALSDRKEPTKRQVDHCSLSTTFNGWKTYKKDEISAHLARMGQRYISIDNWKEVFLYCSKGFVNVFITCNVPYQPPQEQEEIEDDDKLLRKKLL